MIVDIGFSGASKPLPAIDRPLPRFSNRQAVNIHGDALRRHEQAMEQKKRQKKSEADLQAALESLASANNEIGRLNGVVARLEAELKAAREKADRAERSDKRFGKSKKDKQKKPDETSSSQQES